MTSYVDVLQNQIIAHTERSENMLKDLEKWGPPLIRRVVNQHYMTILWLQWQKDRLAELLIQLLNRAIALARRALAMQREFAAMLGSPDTLRMAADDLGSLVGLKAEQLQLLVVPDGKPGTLDANWTDSDGANEVYEQGFTGQAASVGKIPGYASGLSDALRSMADTIEWFYVELAATALSILIGVIGLITAIVSLCLIVSIVTAVPAILGAVTAQLGFIGALIGVAMMALTLTQNTNNTVESLPGELVAWAKPASV